MRQLERDQDADLMRLVRIIDEMRIDDGRVPATRRTGERRAEDGQAHRAEGAKERQAGDRHG